MFLHNGEKPWLKKKQATAMESELGSLVDIDIDGQNSDALVKAARDMEGVGEEEEEEDEEEEEEDGEEKKPAE